jgi:general secretion pathway protein K
MKIRASQPVAGIALIIVLLVIVVLGMLAAGFAYSMKVEMKLARNATFDAELEWLGRSGVELAKYVLAMDSTGPFGQIDSLMNKWAGGPGDSNSPAAMIPLDNYPLGSGVVSVKIVDLDRKFNINMVDRPVLEEALALVGVEDGAQRSSIIDSIIDWRDRDDNQSLSGAESDDYTQRPNWGYPPHVAKNGPIDDISELLMIQGVSPGMFWGSASRGHLPARRLASASAFDEATYAVGLNELFTALSGGRLNVNTASATTLQVLPGLDANIAQAIISRRAGPDGAEGTPDDMPFRSPAEIGMGMGPMPGAPGLPPVAMAPGMMAPGGVPPGAGPMPGMGGSFMNLLTVRSLIFEVRVTARISGNKREFVAVLRRANPRDIQTLSFYWN